MGRKAYPPGEVAGEVIGTGFRHNGKVYTAGERADLDPASAESLAAMGRFRAFAAGTVGEQAQRAAKDLYDTLERGVAKAAQDEPDVDPPAPDDDEG